MDSLAREMSLAGREATFDAGPCPPFSRRKKGDGWPLSYFVTQAIRIAEMVEEIGHYSIFAESIAAEIDRAAEVRFFYFLFA